MEYDESYYQALHDQQQALIRGVGGGIRRYLEQHPAQVETLKAAFMTPDFPAKMDAVVALSEAMDAASWVEQSGHEVSMRMFFEITTDVLRADFGLQDRLKKGQ